MSDLPTIPRRPSEEGQPGLMTYASGYEVSDEVAAVATKLIGEHPRLRFLDDFGVAYLLHHTDPPAEGSPHVWGKARLVPKWARALTSAYDAAVTINEPIWRALQQEQHREALVLHELLHFGTHEKTGELVTVPHDVEEFGFVAAQYGAWRPDLRAFGEQLALGLGRGG